MRAAPLDDRLRQQPPARRAARAAAERARRGGDRARAPRLAGARAAGRDRGAAEGRADPVPRRHLEPRARHRHGRRRPRRPGRVPEVGRARPAAGRPRRPRARRGLEGPHLPEVPRRPARVAPSSRARCATARSRRRRSRATRSTCSRSRSSRSWPRTRSRSTSCTGSSAAPIPFADLSRAAARERARHARRPLPVGRVRRAAAADRLGPHRRRHPRPHGRAAARGHERGHDPRPRALRRLPRRRRRPRRRARRGDGLRGAAGADVPARRVDVADRGDHARPRARLAGARRPRGGPVLEGRGRRPAVRARARRSARASRELVGAERREGARAACATTTTSTSAPRGTSSPSCASRQAATGAVPSDRTIVVERFRDEIGDWRVCILTPFGGRVHAPWAMALAARLRDVARARGAVDLVGRRHRAAPPRRGRAAAVADLLIGPDEIEELVVQEVGQTALFGARFRENAARALLIPRRRPGPAHAALAAAAEGAEPAAGRAQVRLVPDRPRDLPRVPAGRLRPAGAEAHPARAADARARPRRGRDGVRVAVRGVAPLRLRRDVHVRGRHAARRAARAGALARPRPAPRAARPGGAARAARPATRSRRSSGQLRGRRRATPTSCTTCCARAATCVAGEYDEGFAETLLARAARAPVPARRRGAADRRRGRRAATATRSA